MANELDQTAALAKRFFDSIEAGNIDAVGACYADNVAIWHNTDGLIEDKVRNLKVLRRFVGHIKGIKYDQRRLSVFAGGFVHQHVLRGTRPDGVAVELPAVLVCTVRDGKITRLDEYFDSAQVAVFTGSQGAGTNGATPLAKS